MEWKSCETPPSPTTNTKLYRLYVPDSSLYSTSISCN